MNLNTLPHTIEVMVKLLEVEYPNEDLNDLKRLCELLNEHFEAGLTESDIVNHYAMSLEEEDIRLQRKHLML